MKERRDSRGRWERGTPKLSLRGGGCVEEEREGDGRKEGKGEM